MTFARFEDIPAWQEAVRLAEGVYDMTESKNWPGSRSLQDQLERAALSVGDDPAEVFPEALVEIRRPFCLHRITNSRGTLSPPCGGVD